MDMKKIVASLQANDVDCGPYAGRGMRDKECFAIFTDEYPLEAIVSIFSCIAESSSTLEECQEIFDKMYEPKSDSMGKGYVLYWLHLKWEE